MYKYTTRTLTPGKLEYLQEKHNEVFRNKRNKTQDIIRFRFNNKTKPEFLSYIINYAADLLETELNITNFVKGKYMVEFHQANLFANENIKSFNWHQDISVIYPLKIPYTVLFYLRKDRTVKGGNLLIRPNITKFWPNKQNKFIPIKAGTIVIMDGEMEHKPEPASGSGCRDIIAVFFHKK